MQPNELKAVLDYTKEVAIKPVHVEIEVENSRVGKHGRGRRGQLYCPTGLIKATVINDGVLWIERRSVAVCGDQTYEIKRKNGVLVEIDRDDFPNLDNIHISGKNVYLKNGFKTVKQMTPYPHTTAVHRDGKTFLRMITSRKAIFSSWGEYSLEIARRDKVVADEEAKRLALRKPQAALMGMTMEQFEKAHLDSSDERIVYLGAEYTPVDYKRNSHGNMVYAEDNYGFNRPVITKEVGKVDITLDRVNEILNALSPAAKKKLGIPKNV